MVQLPTEVDTNRMAVLEPQEKGPNALDSLRDNYFGVACLETSLRQGLFWTRCAVLGGCLGCPRAAVGCACRARSARAASALTHGCRSA